MNLKKRVANIYIYRHVLWEMSVKQLRAKYAGSVLGIAWAIVNPLLMTFAIVFVFDVILKVGIKNFPLFVLAGMFPWMFFSGAVSEATTSLVNQQSILRQFTIPREILPLASVLSNFFNYLIGWLVMTPLFLFLSPRSLPFFLLLLPVFFLNLLFVGGLGLLFSVLNVFFRDIGHLLGVLMLLWLWVTPVFYSQQMVPEAFRWVGAVNPMTPFIIYYREIIYSARVPGISLFLILAFWSCASLAAGLWVFSRLEPHILKRF